MRLSKTRDVPSDQRRGGRTRLKTALIQSVIALFVGVLGLAVLAGLEGCSTQHPDIARMVMDAKTPADHEAIAAYYENEAAANEASASSHRQLTATCRECHNTYKTTWLLTAKSRPTIFENCNAGLHARSGASQAGAGLEMTSHATDTSLLPGLFPWAPCSGDATEGGVETLCSLG